jgi:molecular chaperone GrpE
MVDPEFDLNTDDVTTEAYEADMDVDFEDLDESGEETATSAKLKKLRDELKQVKAERMEYLTAAQRANADYVNFKKGEDERLSRARAKGTESVIMELLPALDGFDMAMGNKAAWEAVDANWRMGVEYLYNQLVGALANSGVTAIDQIDVPFDPNLHEAIETIETDDASKDHTIAEIIQKGFQTKERVIRAARVKVFAKK